jgi:hypothetical protein
MPDAMQHLAREILVTAAIVVFGYAAFVAGVVILAQFIDWVKCGGFRKER